MKSAGAPSASKKRAPKTRSTTPEARTASKNESSPRPTTRTKPAKSAADALTMRELGRATLARQMLLARHDVPLAAAVSRLFCLQAQLARPPFVGLFARLARFERGALVGALLDRKIVRSTFVRATLSLTTAEDYLALRGALQPALDAALQSVLRAKAASVDVERMIDDARPFFGERPRRFEEVRAHLSAKHGGDERALGYAARLCIPLVQVPEAGARWGFEADPEFDLAEKWLQKPVARRSSLEELVRRYLASYGPSSVADAQAWLGLRGLAEVLGRLRPELVSLRGEDGRELFDLPDAPRPGGDLDAPVRFLPEWDNAIVARADSRFVAERDRARIFKPGLRVLPVVLLDGFVAATWGIEASRTRAILTVEPFRALTKPERAEIEREGSAVLAFVEPDVEKREVRM